MTLEKPKLEIEGLAKRYERAVLEDLALEVFAGELVCVLGPNGSGKTTLLRILAGLEMPDAGSVLIDGRPVAHHARRVGMVFQEPRLLAWKTVRDNIRLCLRPVRVTGREASDRADAYIGLVGLHGFEGSSNSRGCCRTSTPRNPRLPRVFGAAVGTLGAVVIGSGSGISSVAELKGERRCVRRGGACPRASMR